LPCHGRGNNDASTCTADRNNPTGFRNRFHNSSEDDRHELITSKTGRACRSRKTGRCRYSFCDSHNSFASTQDDHGTDPDPDSGDSAAQATSRRQ
jgi:hypothetical protein